MNEFLSVVIIIGSLVLSALLNKDGALIWFIGAVTGIIVSMLAVVDIRRR